MSLSLVEPDAPTRVADPAPAGWRRWWRLPGRLPVRTVFVQAERAWSWGPGEAAPQAHGPTPGWTAELAGGDVRLVLSGLLTHQIVVSDPALPLEDTDSLLAWARHQFVHYHGPAAERWVLAPWLTRTQRGASAAHGIDLEALQREAAAHGVRLRAAQPWWAVALQSAGQAVPALTGDAPAELWIVEGLHVTRVACARRRIVQIEQHWLERPDGAALAALAQRLEPAARPAVLGYGLQAGEGAGAALQLLAPLDGVHPAARWLGR